MTYPLTESQMGIFLSCITNPGSTQYNLPSVCRLSKEIDTDRFAKTCAQFVECHPTIKTRFVMEEGVPRQFVDDTLDVSLRVLRMSEADAQEYFKTIVRPFDLLSGEPLARWELIETEEAKYFFYDSNHSINDGVSLLQITANALSSLYSGGDAKKEVFTIMDYALEEAADFGSDSYQRAKEHYAELFADVDLLSLAIQEDDALGKVVRHSSFLPMETIDEWCKERGVQPSWLFQAAFCYVMSEMSYERKLGYTFVVHGRFNKRIRDTFGMYVKTIPAVAKIDAGTGVLDFVRGFCGELMSAVRYGSYPFNHFCRDNRQKRGVSFGFQGAEMIEELVLDGKHYTLTQIDRDTTASDLDVFIYMRNRQYDIRVEASDALYSGEMVAQVSEFIRKCVLSMMANADKTLGAVSLLDEEDRQKVISMSAGPVVPLDFSKTWVDLFLACAAENSGRLAVADDKSEITYAQLDRRSDLIAQKLVALGVQRRDFVGVMTERSKEFAVCVLGIHKAGAAYLPLDLEYPNERLQYMLEDSGANVLITTHSVLAGKRKSGGFDADKIIFIDDIEWEIESSGVAPINLCTPECYTYIIYTSGSTGQPKGVVLHHKGLLNYVFSTIAELKLTSEDRISSHRSFSFDSHIEDLYAILTVGGSLHIMPEEIRKDLQAIYDFVAAHKITGGGYTTSIATMLCNTFDMPVRYISAIGEKLVGVVSRGAQIVNAYGPTECTDHISLYNLEKDREYKDIPIGHVIANSWCFIVNAAGQLVPRGCVGELCIAGIQVGVGYWQRPELTAKAFVDCPFVDKNVDGSPVRMYHTGDLARYNDDGDLECLGRIDSQVKLRGYRVELGEIEAEAMRAAGVQQAVAMIRPLGGENHLVLYYTAGDGAEVTEDQLNSHLKASKLAAYMIPEALVRLDAMPRTPNGKINRRALPEPEIKRTFAAVPPKTLQEKILLGIVEDILCRKGFGVTDDLNSLGLSSLAAIKVVEAARKHSIDIKVGEVLKYNNIRDLLKASHNICYFAKERVDDKPIVAISLGISAYSHTAAYIDALSEYFSVFVLESIIDHYDYLFSDAKVDEVAKMYATLLDTYINPGDEVVAMTGHCFGGELIYRMAVEWSKMTGQTPPVMLLDTFWSSDWEYPTPLTRLLPYIPEALKGQFMNLGINLDEGDYGNKIIWELSLGDNPPAYGGQVVLQRAMETMEETSGAMQVLGAILGDVIKNNLKKEDLAKFSQKDNEIFWSEHAKNLICHHVKASHNGMLQAEFVRPFAEELHRMTCKEK